MIDLKSIENCYEKFEISDVVFIQFENNMADVLTKAKGETIVKETLHNTQLSHAMQQWNIGNKKNYSIREEKRMSDTRSPIGDMSPQYGISNPPL